MAANIISLVIGIVCTILGISNMRGNISSLHSYHTHRVSEEDRIPFGRKVGFGTVLIGCAIAFFSVMSAVSMLTDSQIFNLIGSVILILGLLIGLCISFYAMIKYNKGIF